MFYDQNIGTIYFNEFLITSFPETSLRFDYYKNGWNQHMNKEITYFEALANIVVRDSHWPCNTPSIIISHLSVILAATIPSPAKPLEERVLSFIDTTNAREEILNDESTN